ncbi:DUF1345 domain-containing protein [Ornithinimicrobium panacihumi]|uniref:DUF1345 domain-containing protein n=1 Tax=Ornithinimicrobium panacihumi TaxID=2008449 RepID=UPI003F89475A
MSTARGETRWHRWSRRDTPRILTATVAGTLATPIAVRLWDGFENLNRWQWITLSCIAAWTMLSAVNALLLLVTFRGVEGEELPPALGLERQEDGTWHCPKKLLSRLDVTVSALALAVVAMLAFGAGVNDRPSIVAAGLVMVAISWINVAVGNALIYARLDLSEGGLEFPGEDRPSWLRYLYLAFGIQATFATPDVQVRTDRLRRAVLAQTLLAFVFNTVTLAVIVAMLLSTGS